MTTSIDRLGPRTPLRLSESAVDDLSGSVSTLQDGAERQDRRQRSDGRQNTEHGRIPTEQVGERAEALGDRPVRPGVRRRDLAGAGAT
ncbi:hypothetical protein ACQPX6_08835 [Actinomycetospora sp. CA-101289]|uniref:hypothetical protein n=1 Tax=Actinomycetospora sp. CA-101289 TaxID=3239893 RepID=UPI003D96A725